MKAGSGDYSYGGLSGLQTLAAVAGNRAARSIDEGSAIPLENRPERG
jgi:hypothetical protein